MPYQVAVTLSRRRLLLGLDAAYDPGWTAGLLYIRNLVYSLAAVPARDRPHVRLLPVTAETVDHINDLASTGFVEISATDRGAVLLAIQLVARRMKRRWLQPLSRRVLDRAFRGLDATFPGFGRPIPGVTQVHWVPDLQHVHLPHLFSDEEIESRNERIRGYMSTPGTVVVSSETSKKDLLAFAPKAVATVRVWRFCTTLTGAERGGRDPRVAFDLPETYLYVANQFWAHKEHLTLFAALRILRHQGLKPTVVCTGALRDDRDPRYVRLVLDAIEKNHLQDQVKLLGVIDRADQIEVLRCAAAVIQPSSFEGWSTVVEDTKAIGRPILLSDISVHQEQAPDATFFAVGNPASLAQVLSEMVPRLTPGPDPVAEEAARLATELRRRQAGASFIMIIREAVDRDAGT